MISELKTILLLFLLAGLISCHPDKKKEVSKVDLGPVIIPVEKPVDSLLTKETKALWINLKRLKGRGPM
jgi:hypothetical protein